MRCKKLSRRPSKLLCAHLSTNVEWLAMCTSACLDSTRRDRKAQLVASKASSLRLSLSPFHVTRSHAWGEENGNSDEMMFGTTFRVFPQLRSWCMRECPKTMKCTKLVARQNVGTLQERKWILNLLPFREGRIINSSVTLSLILILVETGAFKCGIPKISSHTLTKCWPKEKALILLY